MSDRKKNYPIGYGKPPKHSQFKPGQSGNRKGRPKGAKGVRASLKRELEAKITVREGNKEVRISKAEAMAKQLTAMGLKGELRAIVTLLNLDPELFGAAEGGGDQNTTSAPEPVDYDILRDFFTDDAAGDVADEKWEDPDEGA